MKKISLLAVLAGTLIAGNSYSQTKLTPELMWKLGRVSEPVVSPDGSKILYGITTYDIKENKGNRELYIISSNGGTPLQLTHTPNSEINALWRPDGKKIGYIGLDSGSPQVWEMNPDGTERRQLTNIEAGIDGFMFAPDMKSIVYAKSVKLDKTVKDKYPDLDKVDARIIDELMYRHWDSWDDFSYSHIFFAPYKEGKVIVSGKDIMENERFDCPMQPNGGMEEVAISPDGKYIVYTCKKLNGKADAVSTNSDLYGYDIESGKTINLTEGLMGYDTNPVFSGDSKKLCWLSMEHNGYESDKNRLFVMDLATGKKEDLSASFDQNTASPLWSNDGRTIYFISGIKATEQIYSIDVSTRKTTQITKGAHDYTSLCLYPKGFIGTKMSISLPTEIFKVDNKGNEQQLTFTNKSQLDQLKFGKVEEKIYKTTDGKDLHTWIIYPPDFDPNKKYPALLYCQGGPQSTVSQFFSYRWNFQLMAANGYIVVAPNRRGLPSFGKEWNDQIAQDWGGQAIKDYLTAIDSASVLPYVNKDRLGAVGASYGGYSVYYLAGVHNKRFKTFIAHCGLFDLTSWYSTTEEMWFANHDIGGPYWNSPAPKSFAQFSPHNLVGNWDTPMLVIHNQKDYRVPVEQGMEAFGVAQMKGIPSRFLYFPDEGHWVNKPQNSLLWNRVFFEWLDKYLKDVKS